MNTIYLNFSLAAKEGAYCVRLEVAGSEPVEGKFDFDLTPDSRMAEVIQHIGLNYCELDDLRDVGSHLWSAILPDTVRCLFTQIRDQTPPEGQRFLFRLRVPKELEGLPWETLYDERQAGFLAAHDRYCVVREPPESITPPQLPDRQPGPLAMLVVIPDGSGLQAEHEWNNLKQLGATLGDAIQLQPLDGRVTPDRLSECLSARRWDVLHFIGHGELDEKGAVTIRLNGETADRQDHWMEAETFATLFNDRGVRLAVLNCCLGAAFSPGRTLSGLGPFLIRHGVPAVVAMRYEIPDDVAVRFSKAFYRTLLTDEEAGRVDLAVEKARLALHRNKKEGTDRAFVTPVFYLVGDPHVFTDLPEPPQRRRHKRRPAPVDVSDELSEAIREGRCVPVVGPGFVEAVPIRSAVKPPGVQQLIEQLGQESEYPKLEDELALCRQYGPWITNILLRRVCQHYENIKKRFQLIKSLRKAYEKRDPPQRLRLMATWRIPAIIYGYFDGLMEEALTQEKRSPRVVNSVCQQAEMEADVPLLVNLCGTLEDENSLVLTEEDFDNLWEELGKMVPEITDIVYGELGRSLLFVGFSPRDQLIRRLASKLLKTSKCRTLGPVFFVCSDETEAEDPYWQKFDVKWIIMDPDELIASLTEIARTGTDA